MKKLFLLFILFILITFKMNAQVWSDNFDDNTLSSYWVLEAGHDATYTLTEVNKELKIDYHRNGSTASQWHQFNLNFKPAPLVLSGSKKIAIKIKSDKTVEINVKPDYGSAGSDWLKTTVAGDNQWAVYTFDMTAKGNLETVWIYIEGGSTTAKNATVYFDDFQICPSAIGDLINAIGIAELLNTNSPEGNGEGQFPATAKSTFNDAITSAKATAGNTTATDLAISKAIVDLQNNMGIFEGSVKATTTLSIVDAKATKATKYLLENLASIAQTKVLFGMHDATSYGINGGGTSWWDDGTGSKSDPKVLVGSHPAVFSLDFYDVVEGGNTSKVQALCKQAYNEGGIVTMCWHQSRIDGSGDSWKTSPSILNTMLHGGSNHAKYNARLDIIANFANTLRNDKGEAIPFIFRLYHEQDGAWFWWGKGNCTTQDYNALWKYTVGYLRDSKNVHNILYAYSPDGNQFSTKANYLAIYPGDSYVDILGLDFYFGVGDQNEINKLRDRLTYIVEYATEKNKVSALTEAGDRLGWGANGASDALKIPNWYTRCILGAIQATETTKKIAYFATWRNGSPTHHFAPYPGHAAVPDFQAFYDDPTTVFLNDLPNMYTPPLQTGIQDASVMDLSTALKLYPTPVSKQLTVECSDQIQSVEIYSLLGQKVLIFNAVNLKKTTLNIGSLTEGMYVMEAMLESGKISTGKIIVE